MRAKKGQTSPGKPGRPPIEKPRNKQINLYVNDSEFEQYHKSAEDMNLEMNVWLREAAREKMERQEIQKRNKAFGVLGEEK